jgi:hypothetical protein
MSSRLHDRAARTNAIVVVATNATVPTRLASGMAPIERAALPTHPYAGTSTDPLDDDWLFGEVYAARRHASRPARGTIG